MNIKKPNNCLNCKAKAELVRFGGGLYQCRCTGCGSLGRLTPYKSDAVKYWNEEHRPEPETLPENVGFVSISADEYAEYQRLKEAAKPMTIGEMRGYCLEWCEKQVNSGEYKIWVGQIGTSFEIREYASAPFLAGIRPWSEKETVIGCFAIIRAIERGELGGQNG